MDQLAISFHRPAGLVPNWSDARAWIEHVPLADGFEAGSELRGQWKLHWDIDADDDRRFRAALQKDLSRLRRWLGPAARPPGPEKPTIHRIERSDDQLWSAAWWLGHTQALALPGFTKIKDDIPPFLIIEFPEDILREYAIKPSKHP